MQEVVDRKVRGQIVEDLALGFESEDQARRGHLVCERNRVGFHICTDIDDNLAVCSIPTKTVSCTQRSAN